jgi:hypothetical protein
MALVLSLAVGAVVDIADYSIAIHSVDSRKTATLRLGPTRSVDQQVQSKASLRCAEIGFHYTSQRQDRLNRLSGQSVDKALF